MNLNIAKVLVVSVVCLCSVSPPCAAGTNKANKPQFNSYAEPFDFKGLKLGMTLKEFKSMPPLADPSQLLSTREQYSVRKDIRPTTSVPLCSGENAPTGSEFHGIQQKNPIYKTDAQCVWGFADDFKYKISWLTLLQYLTDYRFSFVQRPEDTEPRLFLMEFSVAEGDYPALMIALNQKFGSPVRQQNDPVQSRAGAHFDSEISYWENASSMIKLTQRYTSVTRGSLEYTLKSHANFATQEKAKADKGAPPKI